MHQAWLFILLSLSSYVSAFYPYNPDKPTHSKRFYPIHQDVQPEKDTTSLLKLDLHKVPKVKSYCHTCGNDTYTVQKRNNQFSVQLANAPTGGSNALGINQDGSDYSYFSTMQFGSKKQQLYMLIDTGSANTWVFSSDCQSDTCSIHNTFAKANSTTLKTEPASAWNLAYGTGEVNGVVGIDDVSFANFTVNMGFGLATNASDDFNNYPMDGILGLGRKASDQLGTPTVMQVLDDQVALGKNILGIHLNRAADGSRDGEVVFGGIDTAKFTGSIYYIKTANDNAWEIPVNDFLVNGVATNLTGRTAIIDTGTTFLLLPPADATALHNLIPGSAQQGESYTIPCSTNVKLEVKINSKLYAISSRDYMGKAISGSSTTCASNIIGHQAFGPTQWILGDVFLKNVYAVFDFDNAQIGFGLPGSGGSTSSATVTATATGKVHRTTTEALLTYSGTSSSSTVSATSSGSVSATKSASATSSGAKASSTSSDSNLGGDSSTSGASRLEGYTKVAFSIALAFGFAFAWT